MTRARRVLLTRDEGDPDIGKVLQAALDAAAELAEATGQPQEVRLPPGRWYVEGLYIRGHVTLRGMT